MEGRENMVEEEDGEKVEEEEEKMEKEGGRVFQ